MMKDYIWKGRKKLDINNKFVQTEMKMVDMSKEELEEAYNHCKTMLYNDDIKNPGRHSVLDLISKQKNKCGAELFLRHSEMKSGVSRITLLESINSLKNMDENKEVFKIRDPELGEIINNLEDKYSKIPISYVVDGCLDRLGTFNKKHITRNFILRQGVWLTPEELLEIKEYKVGATDRMGIIKEILNIKDVEVLNPNSTGLTFTELKLMLKLKHNKKYSDLSTAQLETLRYKILFILESQINYHINQWEERMNQINEVLKYKGWN